LFDTQHFGNFHLHLCLQAGSMSTEDIILHGGTPAARHRRRLVDDLGGNLDIMVVWTQKAECAYSDEPDNCAVTDTTTNNMNGLIGLAVAETNVAYIQSGIETQLRLVHSYRHPTYVEGSIAGLDSFQVALNDITNSSDGIMDDIPGNRAQYGADIVSLLIDDDDPRFCGLAFGGTGMPQMDRMFSVIYWLCASGVYSLGHEIGHNMVSR
jgi:hypothetical protein